MTQAETFGARIKRHRLALGLTQRELAARVKVGVPHISKVEADREKPSDDLILRLAQVFHQDPDELFLAARKLPPTLAEDVAIDPARALEYFRSMRNRGRR